MASCSFRKSEEKPAAPLAVRRSGDELRCGDVTGSRPRARPAPPRPTETCATGIDERDQDDRPFRRTPPGHARTARAQGALARADARLGAGAADRADEPRRVPREPGLALPGAAADEAQGVDPLGVAGDGEQPTRSLLHADAVGRAAARAGACGVGARVACGE